MGDVMHGKPRLRPAPSGSPRLQTRHNVASNGSGARSVRAGRCQRQCSMLGSVTTKLLSVTDRSLCRTDGNCHDIRFAGTPCIGKYQGTMLKNCAWVSFWLQMIQAHQFYYRKRPQLPEDAFVPWTSIKSLVDVSPTRCVQLPAKCASCDS